MGTVKLQQGQERPIPWPLWLKGKNPQPQRGYPLSPLITRKGRASTGGSNCIDIDFDTTALNFQST